MGLEVFPDANRNHELNRRLSLLALEKLGCRAEAVVSGREVLERRQNLTYDVVLFDVRLADMDGSALAAAIREREKANSIQRPVRLIALAARETGEERAQLLASGIDAIVGNPPALTQLKQAFVIAPAGSAGKPVFAGLFVHCIFPRSSAWHALCNCFCHARTRDCKT